MAERPLRILQVSTVDFGGGAEKVAWNLFKSCRAHGYDTWLAVRHKRSDDPAVLVIPSSDHRSQWTRTWLAIESMLSPFIEKIRGAWRLREGLRWIGQPARMMEIQQGHEDFDFPGTWEILDLLPQQPDILHCHNLHGGYFDLRALPWLSQQVSVLLTLHDAWLLSGHCAHSFGCERWETGCGSCPDLTIYPSARQDATAYNWQRKHQIYTNARLYIATPCRWLMQKVERSILAPSIRQAKIIPNGVDLSLFHAANRQTVRAMLAIPQDVRVLLFIANRNRWNIWKDYQTMQSAVSLVAEHLNGQKILIILLGEEQPAKQFGRAEVRLVPYQEDPAAMARYYQASDVYVHPARADTFPNTVLEALACGIPVVATAVGGIPEQVNGLKMGMLECSNIRTFDRHKATGVLVPVGDSQEMATGIKLLLTNEVLRCQLGENATQDAQQRFGLDRQVKAYLQWYQSIVESRTVDALPPADV